MILDRQGRLFGRINLLDLMTVLFLLALASTLWYAVRVSRYRSLQILSSEPKRVVAGSGTRAVVKGTGFDPETTIRLGDYNDEKPDYLDESTAALEIRDRFEPGIYRVIVHDGQGRYAALPDAVEVVWQPEISKVNPRILYSQGTGAHVEVFGKFFTSRCSLRIGDRELSVVTRSSKRLEGIPKDGDAPLPLGEQDVTVTNPEGQSATLKRGVTVFPPPEVHRVEPKDILLGKTVEVALIGKNFRDGIRVWFSDQLIGEAKWVSPELMRISVTGSPQVARQGLTLELPGGPKVLALENALNLRDAVTVPVVVVLILDPEKNGRVMDFLRQFPEWRLKRPLPVQKLRRAGLDTQRNFNRKTTEILDFPTVEVVLAARVEPTSNGYRILYEDEPLHIGLPIVVTVNGKRVVGVVATEPFAIFGDDQIKTGGGY